MAENYKINEYGEIIREDYFFRQVQGSGVQILPFERKVWKIYLLSLVTFGIYGLVMAFAMAKETNIACVEDGKHTRGFWGVIGLSIITLGIYSIVWYVQWLNREAAYLERHNKTDEQFKGSTYLILIVLLFVLSFVVAAAQVPVVGNLLSIGFGIFVWYKLVTQHNEVCATYNEINNFVQKV
ncbi:MAG: DUF4234 domain-containing protein [Dysgonamonadaceae bacterium]|jgi:hypothetical protein|nr:DUF4234 domain-containing protein [Dysgonamonadaceae bacterium]